MIPPLQTHRSEQPCRSNFQCDWKMPTHRLEISHGLFPQHVQRVQPFWVTLGLFLLLELSISFFKKIFRIYLVFERGERREKEGEKRRPVASPRCPHWGLDLQPRHLP